MTKLKILHGLFGAVNTIVGLGDQKIINILSEIGDNSANAALKVLKEDLPLARDKSARLNEVIGHFNASVKHYLKYVDKAKEGLFGSSIPNPFILQAPKIDLSYEKCFTCSSFVAMCYQMLQEAELTKKYALEARKYFYSYIWYSFYPYTAPHYGSIDKSRLIKQMKNPIEIEWIFTDKLKSDLNQKIKNEVRKVSRNPLSFLNYHFNRKLNFKAELTVDILNNRFELIEKEFKKFAIDIFGLSSWYTPTFRVGYKIVNLTVPDSSGSIPILDYVFTLDTWNTLPLSR